MLIYNDGKGFTINWTRCKRNGLGILVTHDVDALIMGMWSDDRFWNGQSIIALKT